MLKSKKFWSYEICEKFNLTDEMLNNYKKKGKFYEDGLYFYEQIGTGAHPAIKATQGTVPTIISFQNVLVDLNTLKILFMLLSSSKVTTLRFSSNKFNLPNLEFMIDSLLNKPNGVYNLTYEWNDKFIIDGIEYSFNDINNTVDEKLLNDLKKTEDLIVSLVTKSPNKLEALCLRGDMIGDKIAIQIFEGLKDPNSTLRILNLFRNNLTNECIKSFSEMLIVNRKLEEINFGRNYLTDESLDLIKENYGLFPMTPEEVEEYNNINKERQEIIKKNEKLRASKKPELEVPYLDEMKEINGTNYRVKNNSLKIINLIQNKFTGNSFENIKVLLDGNDDLLMTVDYKIYSEEQRNVFTDTNGKYVNRLYLLK